MRAGARPELLSPLGWLTLVSGLVPLFAGLRELFGRTDPVTGMPSSPTSPYWILAAVLAPVLIWITVGIVAAYSAWSRRRRSPPGS